MEAGGEQNPTGSAERSAWRQAQKFTYGQGVEDINGHSLGGLPTL